ncbi:exported hypothetical protein [Cupriavidus taiwanensis]|uniref:Secreted protein n=1 Tax=Cupriavidus taiwanensis TaxID=164546 RepID=A0A375JAT2_9BURK|nr:exported hypothetical protein [Cupriavidus taiwanensis]
MPSSSVMRVFMVVLLLSVPAEATAQCRDVPALPPARHQSTVPRAVTASSEATIAGGAICTSVGRAPASLPALVPALPASLPTSQQEPA